MIITEIRKTKNSMRYILFVDGANKGYFIDEILAKYKLKTGDEIDKYDFEKIKEENDEKLAFELALTYLETYNVSTSGIKKYLTKKLISKSAIDGAIEKLKEYGYIDDRAFAKNYYIAQNSTHGKRKIANMLRQKGVDPDVIDEVMQDVTDESEYENALALGKKFAKNRENNLKNKQKCVVHLVYKGYDYSVAQKIASIVFTEEEYDDWD